MQIYLLLAQQSDPLAFWTVHMALYLIRTQNQYLVCSNKLATELFHISKGMLFPGATFQQRPDKFNQSTCAHR